MKPDKAILSCNIHRKFLDFVPLAAQGWKNMGVCPRVILGSRLLEPPYKMLAFIQERLEVECSYLWVPPHRKPVLDSSVGKLARLLDAAEIIPSSFRHENSERAVPNEFVMIDDMDTVPLNRGYFDALFDQMDPTKLNCVGHEVYEGHRDLENKFPMSTLTATRDVFRKTINPNGLRISDLVGSWCFSHEFDAKESPCVEDFSDESLMRSILAGRSDLIHKIRRDAPINGRKLDIRQDWIDRSWWGIDEDRLKANDYAIANLPRPYKGNEEAIKPLVEHVLPDPSVFHRWIELLDTMNMIG